MSRSRFFIPLLVAFMSVPACAAGLVNINTADDATLETLPGIGPTKAAAIISYRTENGPFAHTEDIEQVSGIGPATYANIAGLITVGASAAVDAPSATGTATASSTASSGTQTYAAPPSQLRMSTDGDQNAFLDVPMSFSVSVRTASGATDSEARIAWSFGDGSTDEGTQVSKTYHYPGNYVVEVVATDGATSAKNDFVVTVTGAQVRLTDESAAGAVITNDGDARLDLSGWRLWAGSGMFRIPSGTILLPKASVLFPTSVTRLPIAFDARLYFPDGVLAAQYVPSQRTSLVAVSSSSVGASSISVAQLSSSSLRFSTQQTADSAAVSPLSETGTAHAAQAVRAPAAATTVAAAGALYTASSVPPEQPAATVRARGGQGFLSSPWTYGFLGMVAVAAGALVLL